MGPLSLRGRTDYLRSWDIDEASSSVVLYVVSSTEQNLPSVPSSITVQKVVTYLPARYAQTVEYLSSRRRTGLTAELSDNHHATIQCHLDHHDDSSLGFRYAIIVTTSGQAEGTVMVKADQSWGHVPGVATASAQRSAFPNPATTPTQRLRTSLDPLQPSVSFRSIHHL